MHGRGVTAVIALAATLAVPAAASAATKTVQAGPPPSQAPKFANASGANNPFPDADANAFFRKTITIRKGDSVRWLINGFHNVLFPQGGTEAPGLLVPDTANRVSGSVDASGQPFWFNGNPSLAFNPLVAAPQGGGKFKTNKLLNSGLPQGEDSPSRYKLKFNKTGSFGYVCSVHAGMSGTVKVVKKRRAVPSARADRRAANREIKRKLNQVRGLVTGANLSLGNATVQAGNDLRSGATIYKFFPANLTVKAGTTVTLQMPPSTTEIHTFTFGPINGKDAYVDQLANNLIGATIDPRGFYVSDPPGGVPTLTPATHGNGFYNTGFLAGGPPVPLATKQQVTFGAPGTYPYLCLIHPFMTGSITVTP
jgi:plastocyanin